MMTPNMVKARLSDIAAAEIDPEEAHGLEDELLSDFVSHIANDAVQNPARCAFLIEDYLARDRQRWFA